EAGADDAEIALGFVAGKGNVALVKSILAKAKVKQASLDSALAAAPKSNAEIIELLTKAGAKEAAVDVKVEAETLKAYVGLYRNEEQMVEYKVVAKGAGLAVKLGSFERFALKAVDDTTFKAAGDDSTTIAFQKDKGIVTGFLQKAGGTETLFQRIDAR